MTLNNIINFYLLLLLALEKFVRDTSCGRKPKIPPPTEKPIMGLKSNKNFIISNAVENILSGFNFV